MTNEQILKKAIEKAVKNGWKGLYPQLDENVMEFKLFYGFLFSHDFAKAFWGEEVVGRDGKFITYMWQCCLQQMVLEKEPLKYLEKFL